MTKSRFMDNQAWQQILIVLDKPKNVTTIAKEVYVTTAHVTRVCNILLMMDILTSWYVDNKRYFEVTNKGHELRKLYVAADIILSQCFEKAEDWLKKQEKIKL